MKILLAGTPNFSVSTFTKIIENFQVVGLIAQPDKPAGRNLSISQSPTVMLAKFHKIPIFQPQNIIDIYDQLEKLDFDILLTMAYGQIIPKKVLDLAKKGSFNVHASLLPKYRGAAPIQYSLLNGDKTTGITLMEMSTKMDAGDIIFQEQINIEPNDTQDILLKKLSTLSSDNIVTWLSKISKDNFERKVQNEDEVTFSPKISKEDERLAFDTMDNTINKIRALSSNPGAYVLLNSDQEEYKHIISNRRVKVFFASKIKYPRALEIQCSDGIIYATDFQFESKRRLNILE